ncbi:MAG: hypothetical protein KF889_01550 [Alphaproteobacteria bacterium]|nr:hypothetical protein [Alphaproteobacteria bacterium]MCW5741590.1 hypothetical protein [Alphaproteobacteria bacterium]
MAGNSTDLVDQFQTDHDLLIELRTEMRGLRADFKDAKANYVTQAEFWPVRMLVYGCTGLILTAVVGALIVLVIKL